MSEEETVVCKAHDIAMENKHRPWSACRRALEDMRIEEEAEGRANVFRGYVFSDDDEG